MVLSASDASCVGALSLSFSFDRDPVSGASGATVLGEATTNGDGRAKLTVGNDRLDRRRLPADGGYAGNDLGCVGSSTSVEITVTTKGGPIR